MRAFAAVVPPHEIQKLALEAACSLSYAGEVRWAKPSNVHLTLKFLGDIKGYSLDRIKLTVAEVCTAHSPFEVELLGIGAFPSPQRARVIWAGVGTGADKLKAIAEDLDDTLHSLGFVQEERNYIPHVTLGRAKNRPVSFAVETSALKSPNFHVREVELIESTLRSDGSLYTTVGIFPLISK